MFDYRNKLQKSQNEKRKGFVLSKICTLFAGDENLKQNVSLYYCTISYYFQKQV